MRLHEVGIHKTVEIEKIDAPAPIKKKLMDMGLTRHTKVTVHKIAPLNDPMELRVRGYALTIRKAEAAFIEVKAE